MNFGLVMGLDYGLGAVSNSAIGFSSLSSSSDHEMNKDCTNLGSLQSMRDLMWPVVLVV